MKITYTLDKKESGTIHQARVEQNYSTGEGHGDFCLTAYGATKQEARQNLRKLALRMARELDTVKGH